MCATEHGVEKVQHMIGDRRHVAGIVSTEGQQFARSFALTDKDIPHASVKLKCPQTGFGMCMPICITPKMYTVASVL